MKKSEKDNKLISQQKFPKKDMVKFLYEAKNKAKKNSISYNLRVENYSNKNNSVYTYGIR